MWVLSRPLGSIGISLVRLCGAREEQDVLDGDVHGQRLLKEVSQLRELVQVTSLKGHKGISNYLCYRNCHR